MSPVAPVGLPRDRLAVLHPSGVVALGTNPFGKDVANLQLWQALARHGGYERLDILALQAFDLENLAPDLLDGHASASQVVGGAFLTSGAPAEAGTLLRGQPYLSDLAWMRRRDASDRTYSLVGLIHSIAPPGVRELIAASAMAPIHPWDALICTSPSVQVAMAAMFDDWGQHLVERMGGRPPPRPDLPLIPLGVHGDDLAAQADRPDARSRTRSRFGVGDEDILVLWVGRLSYFEKAYPQPMFKALQEAAVATGANLTFIMAGWFPEPGHQEHYETAAHAHAPDVDIRFADGNDKVMLADLWAGADIFLSLVDNIQETFGLTPLEAMAAGLPVVASDWDGYRYTMRDGIEAFLVPTLGGPFGGGIGLRLADLHALGATSYQAYAGAVAQHTAVHVGRAAAALSALIRSADRRRRMDAAGRTRIREVFDWPVVARQVHDLTTHLSAIRTAAPESPASIIRHPVKGDPFRDFAPFATHVLTFDTLMTPVPDVSADDIRRIGTARLDAAFSAYRATPALCADAFTLISERGGATVREILLSFPVGQRRALEMGLAWMAKYGFVDWLS